ncbi:MAG: glycosyltransferase family 4 protein [Armatimonadota bacterium]
MKIAILSETFSKNMGYIQNTLPKYMARLGHDVHLITMDLPPYYQLSTYNDIYGGFTGKEHLIPGTVEDYDGYTLHILGHHRCLCYTRMTGQTAKLRELKPDIVQAPGAIGWISIDAALAQPTLGYKLFTGAHTTKSIFPLAYDPKPLYHPQRLRALLLRALPGRMISTFTEKCYAATSDCGEVAYRFFGVQKSKIDVCPLGVDLDKFSPALTEQDTADRLELRKSLGFADDEIVCIYSGRLMQDKMPLVLAKAIAKLQGMGEKFRGLFMGNGQVGGQIAECPGCVCRDFVPYSQLSRYFRASDIGVWPAQESMSMLDAAACGLPIVVNDSLIAVERIKGNGIKYKLGDVDSLVSTLMTLKEPGERARLGNCGAERMKNEFSWEAIARRRLADYEAALSGGNAK